MIILRQNNYSKNKNKSKSKVERLTPSQKKMRILQEYDTGDNLRSNIIGKKIRKHGLIGTAVGAGAAGLASRNIYGAGLGALVGLAGGAISGSIRGNRIANKKGWSGEVMSRKLGQKYDEDVRKGIKAKGEEDNYELLAHNLHAAKLQAAREQEAREEAEYLQRRQARAQEQIAWNTSRNMGGYHNGYNY